MFGSRLAVALTLVLLSAGAHAQSNLTQGDILQGLAAAGPTAAEIGLNVDAMRADIHRRIQVEGTENAASPPPVLQALAKMPNLTVEIQFDFDSDWIRPESYRTIGLMADSLRHPVLLGFSFLIVGHTDAAGTREYNLGLSERRAQRVKFVLETTFGIDARRLLAVGFGEEQLRNTSDPKSASNRRVQLLNIGPT